MRYQNVITLYESVAEITNKMLVAAQQQDWDRLGDLEQDCAEYVEKIKDCEDAPLTAQEYSRKIASIKLILANDREIRNLMAPWMMKLNTMLNNNSKTNQYARSNSI